MKKLLTYLSIILCLIFAVYGCSTDTVETDETVVVEQQIETDDAADVSDIKEPEDAPLEEVPEITAEETVVEEEASKEESVDEESVVEEQTVDEDEQTLDENAYYTSPEEVALYIHTYGKLPGNFITKQEAEDLGWISKEGNLDEVAPGMSIGGNRFGNYEQALPEGNYKECDVNYTGGYRGDERLVYSEDGAIYYTDDHYATFTQLY